MDTLIIEVGALDVKYPYVANGIVIAGDDATIEIVQLGDAIVPQVLGYAIGPKGEPGVLTYTPEFAQARDEALQFSLDAQGYRNQTATYRDDAATAVGQAQAAATGLATARDTAVAAKTAAEAAKTAAETAKTAAEGARDTAVTAKNDAQSAVTTAQGARDTAVAADATAQTAKTDAVAAKNASVAAQGLAESARDAAQSSASSAATSASEAADAAATATSFDFNTISYLLKPEQSAGVNLNTLLTSGVYFFETAANATTALNFPVASGTGRLLVERSTSGSRIWQSYLRDSSSQEYLRFSTDGGSTWTGWQLYYNSGSISTISQSEAETGTAATVRSWTAQRVRQAIVAYAAALVHTHTIANVTGLQTALDAKAPLTSPALIGTPTAPTPAGAENSTIIPTTAWVNARIDAIVNGAPGVMDTLRELADALGDDPNFAATIAAQMASISTQLSNKSNIGHQHTIADITDLTAALDEKASAAAFTVMQSQVDQKADAAAVYVKTQVDTALGGKLDKTGGTVSGDITIAKSSPALSLQSTDTGGNKWGVLNWTDGKLYFQKQNGTAVNALVVGADGSISTAQLGDLSARIEARATAWANDRVANLSFRKVSVGNFSIPDNGLMMCPAGAVFTGMNMQGTSNNPAMYYHYLQAYDPVRGWVTFSGS
jgi:hypothetical protein